MVFVLIFIIALVLAGLLIIRVNSPGKLTPLKDAQGTVIPGAISEKVWIEAGGIRQGTTTIKISRRELRFPVHPSTDRS